MDKVCARCGKEFRVYPSRLGAKFCSRECNNTTEKEKGTAKILTCPTCGKRFKRHLSQLKPNEQNFCSPTCWSKPRRVPNSKRVTPKRKTKKRMVGGVWSTKKADLEFSHWIRDRDKKTCFFCGKAASQNSHFWGRGSSATRYDPENCDYVCGGCHMRHEGSKQGLYRTLKIEQLGKKRYDALERRARSTMKRSDAIVQCMILLSPTTR